MTLFLALSPPSRALGVEVTTPGAGPSAYAKAGRSDVLERDRPDPAHVDNLVERGERAVRLNVVQDRTRLRRPDPVDGVQGGPGLPC